MHTIKAGVESFDITNTQYNNLRKLAAYLAALPKDYEHFDMEDYFTMGNNPFALYYVGELRKRDYNICGTAACAAGHGPAAGIRAKKYEGWCDYCERVFGLKYYEIGWEWCFGDEWRAGDNTPLGAAKRITFMLNRREIPARFYSQQRGRRPLIYTNIRVPKYQKAA